MKYIVLFAFFGLLFTSCTDDELDPLRKNQIKKGSYLALRGTAFNNLFDDNLYGGAGGFSVAGSVDQNIVIETDYLSEDQNTIGSVDVFVKYKNTGNRVKLTTIPGSNWTLKTNSKSKNGSFTLKLGDILTATGVKLADIPATDGDLIFSFFVIELDLTLTDGSKVPAASIVNSSLFESALFYPAHKLNYYALK